MSFKGPSPRQQPQEKEMNRDHNILSASPWQLESSLRVKFLSFPFSSTSVFPTFILRFLPPGLYMDWNLLQILSIFGVCRSSLYETRRAWVVFVFESIKLVSCSAFSMKVRSNSLNHTLYDTLHVEKKREVSNIIHNTFMMHTFRLLMLCIDCTFYPAEHNYFHVLLLTLCLEGTAFLSLSHSTLIIMWPSLPDDIGF